MKTIARMSLIIMIVITAQTTAISQVVAISGESFRIPELSAILALDEDEVKVIFAMPVDIRLKRYREVDLEQGDIVLYLNGIRVKTLDDFKDKYESLEIGDNVQIGLRRGDERFISSFEKADPDDLPQMPTRVARRGGEGGENSGGISRSINLGPDAEGAVPVVGLGALLKDSEDGVRVIAKLPLPGLEHTEMGFQKDDIVVKLNGNTISSVGQLTDIYDQIEPGQKVELEYKRGGKSMSDSFDKPAIRGNIMIRTNEN